MTTTWPAAFKRKTFDIFLVAIAFAVCLELLALVEAANDAPSRKSLEENPQIDNEYSKRGWKTDLPMWGKRGWNNLHSGWGKRDSDSEENFSGPSSQNYDKRAWQRLQGGWGKRYIPSEDEMVMQQVVASLDEDDVENNGDFYPDENVESSHEVNKRNWKSFSDGWGKRSNKWDKFRGSWGKRQPAWNNLKGLWGKRSPAE